MRRKAVALTGQRQRYSISVKLPLIGIGPIRRQMMQLGVIATSIGARVRRSNRRDPANAR